MSGQTVRRAFVAAVCAASLTAAQREASAELRFVDVAAPSGLVAPTWCGRPEKPHILESGGTGLALFDYDRDGDLDVYLVNGWRLQGATVVERGRNVLYRNRGDGWRTGVAVGDVDGDGEPDLFVSNFGPDVLYRNRGDGTFERLDGAPGIDGWSTGAVFLDADADGHLDLYVAAYIDCTLEEVLRAEAEMDWEGLKVMKGPFGLEGEGNRYFRNLGDGRFEEATQEAGLPDVGLYYSFGVLAADLDGDGDLDLAISNVDAPPTLLRNESDRIGTWLVVDAGGALRITATTAAGRQVRHGVAGGSYVSVSDRRFHLGLGGVSSVLELSVAWPGATRSYRDLPAARTLIVPALE